MKASIQMHPTHEIALIHQLPQQLQCQSLLLWNYYYNLWCGEFAHTLSIQPSSTNITLSSECFFCDLLVRHSGWSFWYWKIYCGKIRAKKLCRTGRLGNACYWLRPVRTRGRPYLIDKALKSVTGMNAHTKINKYQSGATSVPWQLVS